MPASLKKVSFLIFAAIACALYWPSLSHPVFFDDVSFFNLSGLNTIFLNGFVATPRWLPYFITAWVDLIFTDGLVVQRIINVVLHIATAFVLYTLVKQISNHVTPHPNNNRAAMVAALLFLLHPLAAYAVGYLIQRTILMATLFGLLALSTYFDGLVTRKKAYFVFSAVFYLLSVFSKEHAILIPAVAAALTPLAAPVTRRTWRQVLLPFSLYAPIAISVLVTNAYNLGRLYEPSAEYLSQLSFGDINPKLLWLLSALNQASLYFDYLLLMIIPNPNWMSIDMRVGFSIDPWQPKYVIGLTALLTYGVTALYWLFKGGRRSLIGFALLSPLLLFVVEFSTVRIQEPFVLYRAYLWMPLLFVLIPALTNDVAGKYLWPTVLAISIAFSFSLNNRLASFSSEFSLWDDAAKKVSDNQVMGVSRIYFNRGFLYLRQGNHRAAISDLTQVIKLDPGYLRAYEIRALAFSKNGNHGLALSDVQMRLRKSPHNANLYALRGEIYKSAGNAKKAQADFERACDMQSIGACIAIGRKFESRSF